MHSCLDHPIHPPRTETDPWDCPVLDDCGYKVSIERGVFQVYRSQEDLEAKSPIDFGVPNLETFVRDMHHLCTTDNLRSSIRRHAGVPSEGECQSGPVRGL